MYIHRLGPNTISINSHTAVYAIYASSTAMDKSSAYRLGNSTGNGLFFMQRREAHNARRRLWAGGFTPQAYVYPCILHWLVYRLGFNRLETYKPLIEKRTNQLMKCITVRRDSSGVTNLVKCIQQWSFDVMVSSFSSIRVDFHLFNDNS